MRRAGVTRAQLEALATAGALDGLQPDDSRRRRRRSLVWGAGAASQATVDRLPGVVTGTDPPPLPTAPGGRRWPTTSGHSGWRPR